MALSQVAVELDRAPGLHRTSSTLGRALDAMYCEVVLSALPGSCPTPF